MPDRDDSERLTHVIGEASASRQQLSIVGMGSKHWLSAPVEGQLLSVVEHTGVVEYRPEELVITARSGTPLKELNQLLSQHQQRFPFEPPTFRGRGTLGGAVAAGISGPGRPWWGSVRDAVLGVEMVNGLGERLVFGGQVMKNVAGYDLSRVQVGAMGTLGLLLSISLRVSPEPQAERTQVLDVSLIDALDTMRRWARQSLPITATCYVDGMLHVRLSGTESSVLSCANRVGGKTVDDRLFWPAVRDRDLALFKTAEPLWRINCPPAAPLPPGPPDNLSLEWGGGQRWWRTDLPEDEVTAYADAHAGTARLAWASPVFAASYMHRLKLAFDPYNVLNAGLVHADAAA